MYNASQYKDNNSIAELTSGKLLLKNIILNLIGNFAPLIVAFFAIPTLIKSLGIDRYGVLNLAWIVIGYFSIFDFGIARALTQLVAQKLGTDRKEEIDELIWTALLLKITLSIIGAVLVGLFSPWIVYHALNVPSLLQPETLNTFYLLSLSIPIVICTAGLRGILEAYQRFGYITVIRILLGIFNYLGPLLVLPFSANLISVVIVLFLARLIVFIIHIFLCFKVVPSLRENILFNKSLIRYLFTFGGWMSISNIISPLMVYLDRFLIAALVSMAAVTYYVTPYDVLSKLWLLPTAIMGVLFPAFSTSFAVNQNHTLRLFNQGLKFIFIILSPVILIIIVLGKEGLQLWLGMEFAQNSAFVLKWLSIGVLINALSRAFFTLLQGIGRPDITAKIHMVELPFYLFTAFWLISNYSIKGAAIAWVARMTLDGLLLYLMTKRVVPKITIFTKEMFLLSIITIFIFLSTLLVNNLHIKIIFISIIVPSFLLFGWLYILLPQERVVLLSSFKTTKFSNKK